LRLSIGAAQLGMNYGISNSKGQTSFLESKKIINFAKKNNINSIDTAFAYGDSEKVLGDIGVSDFKITTKISLDDSVGNIRTKVSNIVEKSLENLKVQKLYGLLLHNTSQLTQHNGFEFYDALFRLKEQKIVQKIGLSAYSPDEISMIIDKYDFDLIQLPFNIFDNRLICEDFLKKLKTKNIEVHVRSVFLQGLLLMDLDKIPKKFVNWKKDFQNLDDWIKTIGFTRLEACISYVKSFKEVDKIVVGVENQKQLSEILNSYKSKAVFNFPKFDIHDEKLINPGMWNML
jgi:aryl-alcohol dehydrogenase-like predicted oxidoreductase